MIQNMDQKTLILGDEYNDNLRQKLMDFFKINGAIILDSAQQVAGSQDIETLTVSLFDNQVIVEAETYIGLSVTGSEKIIKYIEDEFCKKYNSIK